MISPPDNEQVTVTDAVSRLGNTAVQIVKFRSVARKADERVSDLVSEFVGQMDELRALVVGGAHGAPDRAIGATRRVTQALPGTRSHLAAATGLRPDQVSTALEHMRQTGRVSRGDDGVWHHVAQAPEPEVAE